jgi:hypothetical protein
METILAPEGVRLVLSSGRGGGGKGKNTSVDEGEGTQLCIVPEPRGNGVCDGIGRGTFEYLRLYVHGCIVGIILWQIHGQAQPERSNQIDKRGKTHPGGGRYSPVEQGGGVFICGAKPWPSR